MNFRNYKAELLTLCEQLTFIVFTVTAFFGMAVYFG